MSFPQAIQSALRQYAQFTGRAGRAEFWWFILFTVIVQAALGSLNILTPRGLITIGSSLAGVWAIAMLLPTLAVTVRRLRDAGRSWAELFWLLLPIAGVIVLIVHLCEPAAAVGGAPAPPAAARDIPSPSQPQGK